MMSPLSGGRLAGGAGGRDLIDIHQLVFPAGDLEAPEIFRSTGRQIEKVAVPRQGMGPNPEGATERPHLRYAAIERPGRPEAEPSPDLVKTYPVVASVDA